MSSEVGMQVFRVALEGTVFMVKCVPRAAVFLAAACKKDADKIGVTNLKNLLSSGKELSIFTLPYGREKEFRSEAKKYGIGYSMVAQSPTEKELGTIDILCKSDDSVRLQRIIEKMGLAHTKLSSVGESVQIGESNTNENSIEGDLTWARELMDKVIQPGEGAAVNPDKAVYVNESQYTAESLDASRIVKIPPKKEDTYEVYRPSVKKELEAVKTNIDAYQPKEEANQAVQLMSQLLSGLNLGEEEELKDGPGVKLTN